MKRGDIYLVDLEPTAGREQRGHRPVLVVSSESFNRLTQCPVILPITNGGGFVRRVGFAALACSRARPMIDSSGRSPRISFSRSIFAARRDFWRCKARRK